MTHLSARGRTMLLDGARLLGVKVDEVAMALFDLYLHTLVHWNRRMNLIGPASETDIVARHFLDSLSIIPFLATRGPLLDIGSGAGFPGVPVKIVLRDMPVVLAERREKRASFLYCLKALIKLETLDVAGCDATYLLRQETHRGRYASVVTRATMPVGDFARLAAPFLAPRGIAIAMKGPGAVRELDEFRRLRSPLSIRDVVRVDLPFAGHERCLVVCERSQ